MKNSNESKMTSGIDSLYYFCESNLDYDHLYLDIIDQFETIKGNFTKKDIRYEPSDIVINIKDITFTYQGRSEGFIFFKDTNDFFRVGFKDTNKNKKLNDIRVELLAVGIYTIGINPLLKYIDSILDGYVTGYKPITRADLNCFVQYDFGFVNKSMFATRKRVYSEYSTHGNANRTETIYVGKSPFKLRLYDKTIEMRKSKKQELMTEYFKNNNFDMDEPIYNVEFEMHRTHLKAYKILTVEDVLANINNLFKYAMDDIRLINIDEVSQVDIIHNNKHRATTYPIWDYIKYNYDAKEFLQTDTPLERIKRALYEFTYEKFQEEFIELLRKAHIHSLPILEDELEDCLYEFEKSLEVAKPTEDKPSYTNIEVIEKSGKKEKFRLLKNGDIIKPINVISVASLSDSQLKSYMDDLLPEYDIKKDSTQKYKIAFAELEKRGLNEEMPV